MDATSGQTAKLQVSIRVHGELGYFVARAHRERDVEWASPPQATVKHVIEALGVPHTEVGLILVDGEMAADGHRLRQGEHISVYPHAGPHEDLPTTATRFIADAHLGGLARLLRMAGFDTLYHNNYQDDQIVRLAREQERIVLSRDRDLLKRREVVAGCFVRAIRPDEQLRQLVWRFSLQGRARPFSLCLECNVHLIGMDRSDAGLRVPAGVLARQQRFKSCPQCRRVYWEGTHWQRMRHVIDTLLG